jgi:hypothetical protein
MPRVNIRTIRRSSRPRDPRGQLARRPQAPPRNHPPPAVERVCCQTKQNDSREEVHSNVSAASALSATEPSRMATRRLANARLGMTTSESAVIARPSPLGRGSSRTPSSVVTESTATYSPIAKKLSAIRRTARRSGAGGSPRYSGRTVGLQSSELSTALLSDNPSDRTAARPSGNAGGRRRGARRLRPKEADA